mmetsp:Transcript_33583/g.74358  ORF Transcript_33583/g.74358 Transcript_33583/m.74358 type:complete len:329 (+) Transcript_33583:172-1158(+)
MDSAFSLNGDILDVFKTGNDILDIDGLADLLDFPEPHMGVDGALPQSHGAVLTAPLPSISHNARTKAPANFDLPSSSELEGGDNSDQTGNNAESDLYGNAPRKRRLRNAGQMEMNRVAQQKYRERKKAEHQQLHNAVEMLTAQLAALKAIEVRASELEVANAGLSQQVASQAAQIQELQEQVGAQSTTIATQGAQLVEQQVLVTAQQKMILDQHSKLKLQEEIIANLKDQVRVSVDEAWEKLESRDSAAVCKRMHEAVRSALMNAKDMEGLQATLESIPDHLVVEICKNILHACRDMWPHIFTQLPCIQGPQAICASAFPAPVPQQCM